MKERWRLRFSRLFIHVAVSPMKISWQCFTLCANLSTLVLLCRYGGDCSRMSTQKLHCTVLSLTSFDTANVLHCTMMISVGTSPSYKCHRGVHTEGRESAEVHKIMHSA